MGLPFDYSAIAVCALTLAAYNSAALCSSSTNLKAMLRIDDVWGSKHLKLGAAAEVTLAIQTLRNSVLVAVFIGTVAFNTMTSTLVLLTAAPAASPLWIMQLIVAVLAGCAFLSFAVCIRCAAHAGYLVGGASFLNSSSAAGGSTSGSTESLGPAASQHMLRIVRMQSFHFSLAFRCIYSAFPFLFGAAAGPVALVVAAAGIAAFQAYLDFAHLWGGPPSECAAACCRVLSFRQCFQCRPRRGAHRCSLDGEPRPGCENGAEALAGKRGSVNLPDDESRVMIPMSFSGSQAPQPENPRLQDVRLQVPPATMVDPRERDGARRLVSVDANTRAIQVAATAAPPDGAN